MIILLQLQAIYFIVRLLLYERREFFHNTQNHFIQFLFSLHIHDRHWLSDSLHTLVTFIYVECLTKCVWKRWKMKEIGVVKMSSESLTIVFNDAQRLTHNRFYSFNLFEYFRFYFRIKTHLFMRGTLLKLCVNKSYCSVWYSVQFWNICHKCVQLFFFLFWISFHIKH